MQSQQNSQCVRWCFTVNNPFDNVEVYINALEEHCKYLVIGKEVGESGTPHYQGYLELKKKQRMQQVKALFPNEVAPHLEIARGAPSQAADYCKKEGSFKEVGALTSQGQRTDLLELTQMITDGVAMQDVALSAPATWVRNYRGLSAFMQLLQKPLPIREDFTCHFYFGKTGTGKTYKAFNDYPGLFAKPLGKGLWFDGYAGQKVVLVDEFTGQWPCTDMLRIADKYQLQVEIKGGHTWFQPELVIFTSNIHPCTYYESWLGRAEHYKAFARRFSKVFYFKSRDDVQEVKPEHFFESPGKYDLGI